VNDGELKPDNDGPKIVVEKPKRMGKQYPDMKAREGFALVWRGQKRQRAPKRPTRLIYVEVAIDGYVTEALLDDGANDSFIDAELAKRLAVEGYEVASLKDEAKNWVRFGKAGSVTEAYGKYRYPLEMGGRKIDFPLVVTNKLRHPIVLYGSGACIAGSSARLGIGEVEMIFAFLRQ